MRFKQLAVVLAARTSARVPPERVERDSAALFLARELAHASHASTIALTVAGPNEDGHVCQEALDLGCDRAICVRSPLALDFFGVAMLLHRAMADAKPDMIICGDHYMDNGGAAVAGALAGLFNWPLLTGVLNAKINSKGLWAQTRADFGQRDLQCSGPLVLAALQVEERAAKSNGDITKKKTKSRVEEVLANSLLEDASILGARSRIAGYSEFAHSPRGVELLSEPAELLSRLLKEKLWKP